MKKNTLICTSLCMLFVALLGTLGHFFYEWSGYNYYVGLFFPVNESTWEHMKLFFFPSLLCYIITCFIKKDDMPVFLYTFPKAILLGTFLIPVLFYTYSGILGFTVTFIDIAIFYISVIVAYFYLYKATISMTTPKYPLLLNIVLLVLALLFMYFSYNPPALGIFQVPS